jgi:hypothetical protein
MRQAEVVHHIAGRMRIRIPMAKREAALMESIRNSIKNFRGVREVSANPSLGTLLIRYDPVLFEEAIPSITEQASKTELFALHSSAEDDDQPPVSQLDRALDRLFGKANRIVEAATGQSVNLKEVFPFGILVYSLFFVDRAIAASQWWSWVQFALSTYLELHEGEPIAQVGDSVKSLRAELQDLREELKAHFGNQGKDLPG